MHLFAQDVDVHQFISSIHKETFLYYGVESSFHPLQYLRSKSLMFIFLKTKTVYIDWNRSVCDLYISQQSCNYNMTIFNSYIKTGVSSQLQVLTFELQVMQIQRQLAKHGWGSPSNLQPCVHEFWSDQTVLFPTDMRKPSHRADNKRIVTFT